MHPAISVKSGLKIFKYIYKYTHTYIDKHKSDKENALKHIMLENKIFRSLKTNVSRAELFP